MAVYPSLYKARAVAVNGAKIEAFVPQVFSDQTVTISEFLGGTPSGPSQGWVFFQAGNPEFPVWADVSSLGASSPPEVWIGPDAPTGTEVLWWDTDINQLFAKELETWVGVTPEIPEFPTTVPTFTVTGLLTTSDLSVTDDLNVLDLFAINADVSGTLTVEDLIVSGLLTADNLLISVGGTLTAPTVDVTGALTASTISASGLITSTRSTASGPPFVVASTARVLNLNADRLDDLEGSAFSLVGHTHEGGSGGVEMAINDLSDVDTVTVVPLDDYILAWESSDSEWQAKPHSHVGQFLPLTGGTITGPVDIQSSLTTDSANIQGALTSLSADIQGNLIADSGNIQGALATVSVSGDGASLTNLNATSLATGTVANSRLPTTLTSSTSGTAASWTTARQINLSGDLSGSTVIKGDVDVTLTASIVANSVDLTTDTVGNYVQSLAGTTNRVTVSPTSPSEGAVITLSGPQDIHAGASPSFVRVISTQTTGTSPFQVASTTMVGNLTAQYLGATAQDAAYFRNATNLNAGLVSQALIPTSLPNLTSVGTLTSLAVTGGITAGGGQTVWHAGNDGPGSGLNADLLDGFTASYFATDAQLAAILTDLIFVGIYDAAAYTGTDATKPHPDPEWTEYSAATYRHGMYWWVGSVGTLNFIDSDLSGRYDVSTDDEVVVVNGDTIIAINPDWQTAGPDAALTISQVVFQYIPSSNAALIDAKVYAHATSPDDPHAAAGYLTRIVADQYYPPLAHSHASEIEAAFDALRAETNPFPMYLDQGEGDARYAFIEHPHSYEPLGAVAAHVLEPNPHSQYVEPAEGDMLWASIAHLHAQYALQTHTHQIDDEVVATDGAPSAIIHIGSASPVAPATGDYWLESFDISLQPPAAPTGLTLSFLESNVDGTLDYRISWNVWPGATNQTKVEIEWSSDGTTWTDPGWEDTTAPFITSWDVVLNQRTNYWYRVRASNLAGAGAWGVVSVQPSVNLPPNPPTAPVVSLITASSAQLAWTPPSVPAGDPLHATQPYEMFRNGVQIATDTASPYSFTGLTENTTYTLGVRSKDSEGLTSSLVTASATTSNATPPVPTGLALVSKTHDTVNVSWTGVSGITDFRRYRMYVGGVYTGTTTTATTFSFTGLSGSTAYTFQVATEDLGGMISALSTGLAVTTDVNPDTTPPPAATDLWLAPEVSYGQMHFRYKTFETCHHKVYKFVNGGDWVLVHDLPAQPPGDYDRNMGTHVAGELIGVAVDQSDALGNERIGDLMTYQLQESPLLVGADATNHWRDDQDQYNVIGNSRPMQGYFTDPARVYIGFWYYGTKIYDRIHSNGFGRRTVTHMTVSVCRTNDTGTAAGIAANFHMHNALSSPGSAAAGTPHATFETHSASGFLRDTFVDQLLPTAFKDALYAGTHRGIAVDRPGATNYTGWYSVTENWASGLLRFHHLG